MPSVPTTLLLPPSEGKAGGGDGPGWSTDDGVFGPALHEQRAWLVDALADAGGGDTRLLGVSGPHLDRAQGANRSLLGAPTLPAWRRYTGVVWDHLDPASLTAAQRRSIVVVSGLLGLARGDDPVPDYRLKMGAALPSTGTLSSWWRPTLTTELLRFSRRRFVVDLLPNEHRAALDIAALDRPKRVSRWVSVVIRERDGGAGGHAAKAAKGELARHVLTHDGSPLDALHSWRHERFVLELVER
jgi:uncharacterized protein